MKKFTLLTAIIATVAFGACATKHECPVSGAAASKCCKDGKGKCCKDKAKCDKDKAKCDKNRH